MRDNAVAVSLTAVCRLLLLLLLLLLSSRASALLFAFWINSLSSCTVRKLYFSPKLIIVVSFLLVANFFFAGAFSQGMRRDAQLAHDLLKMESDYIILPICE